MSDSTVTAQRTVDEFGNSFYGAVDVSKLEEGERVEIGRAPYSTVCVALGEPVAGSPRTLENEVTGERLVIDPDRIGMGRVLEVGRALERRAALETVAAYDEFAAAQADTDEDGNQNDARYETAVADLDRAVNLLRSVFGEVEVVA
jgi:hypothetical protein